MENVTVKNELTKLFYSLPISEEKTLLEWIAEQKIIKSDVWEYNLEDGYAVTKNVICVEDRYFQFEMITTYGGYDYGGYDYETEAKIETALEVEPYATLVTKFKEVK